jgi:hypothetical protein
MHSRVFVISLATLAAIVGYLWVEMRFSWGIPVISDMPFVIFHISVPIFVLALLVGAMSLWIRSRHPAALLQFVSCCIAFVLVAFETLGKWLDHGEKAQLSEFMRQPILRSGGQIIILLCFLSFLTGYVWYARVTKRIQQCDWAERCAFHIWDDFDPFTASDTRLRPPSLILFSLDKVKFIPLIACGVFYIFSLWFGFHSFSRDNRALPRWIRLALLMIALSWFAGATIYAALCLAADRLSPSMHRVIFDIVIFVCSAGIGIVFLLAISGEYAKASRDLNTPGRKRPSSKREVSDHEHV